MENLLHEAGFSNLEEAAAWAVKNKKPLVEGFTELLNYVEDLERIGRAPYPGHRRPCTNFVRTLR